MAIVKLDQSRVTALLQDPSEPVHKDFTRRILKIHGAARRNCPVKTGRLRSSIRYNIGRDVKGLVAVVSTDLSYALFVHQGTRPHVITAKNKKALYWRGARHPVRSVNHPGTRGQPFLLDALKEAL